MAFEGAAKALLTAHAVLAALLVAACGWHAALTLQLFRGRGEPRRVTIWSRIVATLFCLSFAVGSMLYPTYRVRVRRDHFDREAQWAANLFDIKEDLLALALPLALVLFVLGVSLRRAPGAKHDQTVSDSDSSLPRASGAKHDQTVSFRDERRFALFVSAALLVLVASSALMGLIVTRAQRMKALAGFCAGWFAAAFAVTVLPIRLFWYLPVARRFEYTAHPLELGMDYYGRVLFCFGCGLLAAVVCASLPRRASRVIFGWSAVLLAFVAILQIHLLWNRQLHAGP